MVQRSEEQTRTATSAGATTPGATGIVHVDDDRFRVTEWVIEPGGRIERHAHALDYVVVPLADGVMHVVLDSGDVTETPLTLGTTYARTAGAVHEVHNRSDAVVRFMEVESKR